MVGLSVVLLVLLMELLEVEKMVFLMVVVKAQLLAEKLVFLLDDSSAEKKV